MLNECLLFKYLDNVNDPFKLLQHEKSNIHSEINQRDDTLYYYIHCDPSVNSSLPYLALFPSFFAVRFSTPTKIIRIYEAISK